MTDISWKVLISNGYFTILNINRRQLTSTENYWWIMAKYQTEATDIHWKLLINNDYFNVLNINQKRLKSIENLWLALHPVINEFLNKLHACFFFRSLGIQNGPTGWNPNSGTDKTVSISSGEQLFSLIRISLRYAVNQTCCRPLFWHDLVTSIEWWKIKSVIFERLKWTVLIVL